MISSSLEEMLYASHKRNSQSPKEIFELLKLSELLVEYSWNLKSKESMIKLWFIASVSFIVSMKVETVSLIDEVKEWAFDIVE